MEYVEGVDCGSTVASAVLVLELQVDSARPGPVGGGPIRHLFFDWTSAVTVAELQSQINAARILDRLD